MRLTCRMAFCVFCSIFDRQKNEKNHFLTSVVPLPRLTYRPSLRFPNTLPQTRMLPLFFGFKGNDLLLIFKLQSPAGGGQLPEPSPFSAFRLPSQRRIIPYTGQQRHYYAILCTNYNSVFSCALFAILPLFGHVLSLRIGANFPLPNPQERAIVWRKNSFAQLMRS